MDAPMTLVIKYGSRGCAKTCSVGYTREELVEFVVSKWDGLAKENVYVSFDLLGMGELDLCNENDMETMFRLMVESESHRVNVYVRKLGGSVAAEVGACEDPVSVYEKGECSQVSSVAPPVVVMQGVSQEHRLLSEAWRLLIEGPGQRFAGGAKEFRKALIKYSIELGFEFDYLRNGPTRVSAVCRFRYEARCRWRINAVRDSSDRAFVITLFERNHRCGSSFGAASKRRMNYHIVADLIVDDIRIIAGLNAVQVQAIFRRNYGIDISYTVAWKSLQKGRSMVYGDHSSSFGLLPLYFEELLKFNEGSHVDLEVGEEMQFRRCFVAFKACLEGFAFCRPVVMIDGTFLKGRHKGCLLSAVAKDGDDGLYPFAFAVVNEESDENWDYFFQHLRRAVGTTRQLVFISDRNHGILKAVRTVFAGAYHAFCYNHLKNNLEYRCKSLGKKVRGLVLKYFQKCAYATSEEEFEENAVKMVNVGRVGAAAFLRDTPREHWASAYFPGNRYGEMTSNSCESWNSQIREERLMPIVTMLDGIRVKLMQQICNRRQVAGGWNLNLCKKMEMVMNSKVQQARGWDTRRASDTLWEVFSSPTAVVDLEARTCSCKLWQINGVPCLHAAAIIYLKLNGNLEYIDRYFHLETYKATYAHSIIPFCMPAYEGAELVVKPPDFHQTRGRPRRRRIPSQGEVIRRSNRCGSCGEFAHHNRQTCRMGAGRG